jgi:hypothetical protein
MKVIISILVLSAWTVAARAEDKPAAEPVMPWEKACDPDMKKLCKDAKGDIRDCLAEHEKELSKDCTKYFSAAGYRVAKLCEGDFEKVCPGAAAKGTLGQCVNANQAKLSAKCRNALLAGSKKADEKADKAAAKAAAKKEKAAEKSEKAK